MNILVLMAGRGKRFSDKGYTVPKPLVQVKEKTILEWTTESCPYINHTGTSQKINLYFAVLQEHLDLGMDTFLHKVYGHNITIIPFTTITRGSLETAYLSCTKMLTTEDSLLILDSDNKYDSPDLMNFISHLPTTKELAAIFVFDSHDKSLPNKWSNAWIEGQLVRGIKEKEDTWSQYPALIGTFYFSSTQYFIQSAESILKHKDPVKGEYYMSMVPADLVPNVYFHKVDNVIPLGTPEDVLRFETQN